MEHCSHKGNCGTCRKTGRKFQKVVLFVMHFSTVARIKIQEICTCHKDAVKALYLSRFKLYL